MAIALCGLLIGTSVSSCQSKNEDTTKAKPVVEKKGNNTLPNYRYVDIDTVLSRYILAQDFNEELIRLQNNAESQMKQHQNKLQNFEQTVQNKMNNNGYLSEASYKQDQQTYQNMANQAQRSMAGLQSNIEQSAMSAQKAIQDSINAFILDYNKSRGYDAILYKGAALYINPDLDITEEVIEGLNARYNKIKK